MRALIQRVSQASVNVGAQTIGSIDAGLLILICAMEGDTPAQVDALAAKIVKLRVFKDTTGKMNLSLLDTKGAALIVSQFTLAADTSRGNRPGFSTAAKPETGRHLYEDFINRMRILGIPTASGTFGADLAVSLTNDGPVTIWLET
ncbi:MAG: D-aminoacyl-tRNA deacylase [Paracoccaceae bacterium]|nr:D-aminoacyl-tRNA deacylase [Paracoccaceae bacterium]